MHATSIWVGILFNTLVLISSFYIFHWFNIFSIFLKIIKPLISSVQLLSRVRPFATPMDCSMPDFPVHHQLPELTQTYVHHVGDAIQPSHPLSSPFPPTFNLSQHQGLFKWVDSSFQVAKILELQFQHQSFQWIDRVDFL